jgi:hypothetical protein
MRTATDAHGKYATYRRIDVAGTLRARRSNCPGSTASKRTATARSNQREFSATATSKSTSSMIHVTGIMVRRPGTRRRNQASDALSITVGWGKPATG